ncbi:MAG: glutathione S-transferase family protein [Alphaproteobacteria bacterium]
MIKLYWCAQTRASRMVWLLEEAGLPYEVVPVDIRTPGGKDAVPGFHEASPMGKVPALADGPVTVADSAAIALYVADRYPEAGLAPAIDAADRGRYLFWMTYSPGVIEPAMAEKFSNATPNRLSHGWGDFGLMVETWEKGLGDSPWILGDRFSAADVMLGSSVLFMRMFGIMPDSPTLAGYADRCAARPAYQRSREREG